MTTVCYKSHQHNYVVRTWRHCVFSVKSGKDKKNNFKYVYFPKVSQQYITGAKRARTGKKLLFFLTSVLTKVRWSTPRSGRFIPNILPGTHFIGGSGNVMKEWKKNRFLFSSSRSRSISSSSSSCCKSADDKHSSGPVGH